jgi:hypothetical protein
MYGPIYFTISGLTFRGGHVKTIDYKLIFVMFEVTYALKCFTKKYKHFKEFEKFFFVLHKNISKHGQCIYGHVMYGTVIVS